MGADPEHAQADFLFTEAEVALTMLESARVLTRPEDVEQSIDFARRAYESLVKFLPDTPLPAEDAQRLNALIERIATELSSIAGSGPLQPEIAKSPQLRHT